MEKWPNENLWCDSATDGNAQEWIRVFLVSAKEEL